MVKTMCLAVPGLVESIDGEYAEVDFGGVRKRVCITMLPGVKVGEYVIVHTGYAIEKLNPEEAKKTLALFEEIAKIQAELNE